MRLKHMSMLIVMALISGVAIAEQPIIIDGNGNLKIVQPPPKNTGTSPPALNQIPPKAPSGTAPAQPVPPSQNLGPGETPQTVDQGAPSTPPATVEEVKPTDTVPTETMPPETPPTETTPPTTETPAETPANGLTSDQIAPIPDMPVAPTDQNNGQNTVNQN